MTANGDEADIKFVQMQKLQNTPITEFSCFIELVLFSFGDDKIKCIHPSDLANLDLEGSLGLGYYVITNSTGG